MGEWTSGLLIQFAKYGYCGHELVGVLLMYVEIEVHDGCCMGILCKDFGVSEGVVCAICIGEVVHEGGLLAPNLTSLSRALLPNIPKCA